MCVVNCAREDRDKEELIMKGFEGTTRGFPALVCVPQRRTRALRALGHEEEREMDHKMTRDEKHIKSVAVLKALWYRKS